MSFNYDLIVLGSGPGGYVAAIRASQLGLKTAIVERENLGGICLNWGCIPTKALLKTAEISDYLAHSDQFGLKVAGYDIDFPAVVKRSRGVAEGMSKGVQFLMRKNKIEVIMGAGRIVAPHQLEVATEKGLQTLSAQHIIVAVGARARSLAGMEIDDLRIIGYRKAMTLEQQPNSIIVMGSGAIGTEFAYFYNSIGTKVTLVEFLPNILPSADAEISKALEKLYKKKGMDIHTNTKITQVEKTDTGVRVTMESPKGPQTLEADVLLSAVGIVANTEGLGLEEVGAQLDKGLIQVDEFYRTGVEGLYAIGDCVPGPALAHKASAEAILCVEALAGQHVEPIDYNNVPACVYCQPEVAQVGLTEAQAKAAGYELKIGRFPFSASGKASAAGKKDGMVKIIYDAKYGELLGCHMMGANVTEMIAQIVTARKLETTGHEILKAIHPHPTMSEAVMEATADAYGEVIHL